MPINEAYQNNFEVLNQAARNGDLCLMETKDAFSGKIVIAVAAHYLDEETEEHVFVPVAKMFDGDPYEELIPPHDPRFDSMPDYTTDKIEQDPIEDELDELFNNSPKSSYVSHATYPRFDWMREVSMGDTVLGYRDWLYLRIERDQNQE